MNNDEIRKWAQLKKLSYEIENQIPLRGPGLEKISEGQFSMTSGDWSPQLSEFIELFYALQIVTPDNLPDDAFEIPDEFNERTISYQDAAELVTCIIRTERFVDGLINKYINNRWLTRLARVLYSRRLLQENGWPKS